MLWLSRHVAADRLKVIWAVMDVLPWPALIYLGLWGLYCSCFVHWFNINPGKRRSQARSSQEPGWSAETQNPTFSGENAQQQSALQFGYALPAIFISPRYGPYPTNQNIQKCTFPRSRRAAQCHHFTTSDLPINSMMRLHFVRMGIWLAIFNSIIPFSSGVTNQLFSFMPFISLSPNYYSFHY